MAAAAQDENPRLARGQGQAPTARRRGRPTLGDEELLDKALDLFLVQGFDGTSMEEVSAAAGVAKRTLYKRYGDKLSLFKATLKQAIDKWIVPMERLQAAECDDLEDSLVEIGRILVLNVMSREGLQLLRITNVESTRIPEIGAYTYKEGTERTIRYLSELFHRRADELDLSSMEPDSAAEAFISLVISGPAERAAWGAAIDEDSLCRRTRQCVSLFLNGIHANRAQPPGGAIASRDWVEQPSRSVAKDEDASELGRLELENRKLRVLLVDALLASAEVKAPLEE